MPIPVSGNKKNAKWGAGLSAGQKVTFFLATGGLVGMIPVAPGTFGSVVGLGVCYLLAGLDFSLAFILVIVLFVLAVRIAGEAEKMMGRKDPGAIVIDEIAGMAVTLLGFPFSIPVAVAGFALFRVLDIIKPPPIRTVERRFSGGFGIVIDDVVAGVLANVILRVLPAVFHIF
jgi:phosphatidylglycerophosphatase A